MPILRNPFRKDHTLDENVRPLTQNNADPSAGFQQTELHGAKPIKPVNAKPIDPTEYQLSGKDPKSAYRILKIANSSAQKSMMASTFL